MFTLFFMANKCFVTRQIMRKDISSHSTLKLFKFIWNSKLRKKKCVSVKIMGDKTPQLCQHYAAC